MRDNSKSRESIDGQRHNINVNANIIMLILHFIAKYNIVKDTEVPICRNTTFVSYTMS